MLDVGDGRVLRGAQLEGATVHITVANQQAAPVRIASVAPDPEHPDILRHNLQVPDGEGGWKSACTPNAHGERWGFPVSLPPGHPGRTGEITITCASGAIAKCARFGYKPWAKGPRGDDLTAIHAACIRMVRADYCGDGKAHTRNGTEIDMFDDLGIQFSDSSDVDGFFFEAGWSPQGAVCVRHTRWPELLTMEELNAQCPRIASLPECSEQAARSSGARLFNRSRANR